MGFKVSRWENNKSVVRSKLPAGSSNGQDPPYQPDKRPAYAGGTVRSRAGDLYRKPFPFPRSHPNRTPFSVLHPPLFLILFLFLLNTSCNLVNPEEPIPAYLFVEPFELRVNPGSQGSASHKITEAWLSIDGEFLGAYSLPSLIPVLSEGTREVTLQAGIRDNGISATPEVYPFFNIYRSTVTLAANEVDTLRPVTQYSDRTRFPLIDDFDRGPTVFKEIRIGTSDNELRPAEDDVFEGNASGLIHLNAQSPVVELASLTHYSNLNENSPYVYLEVNYKSDVPVVFGVVAHQLASPGPGNILLEPGFLPRDDWNKIYFNLSPLIAAGNFDSYQIAFQAAIPQENGQLTSSEAFIRLDNIKLVHF